MTKRRGRTAYTEEFRREAVRLVEADPSQLARVARELGVHGETLRSWYHRVLIERERAQGEAPGPIVAPPRVLSLEEENRRLRRENARLQEEREILKKAMAFFAKDAR